MKDTAEKMRRLYLNLKRDIDALELEEIEQKMIADGIDPNKNIEDSTMFFKRLNLKAKAQLKRKEATEYIDQLNDAIIKFREMIMNTPKALLEEEFKRYLPQIQYRNLEEMSEEEIKAVLEEGKMLELLEKYIQRQKDEDK